MHEHNLGLLLHKAFGEEAKKIIEEDEAVAKSLVHDIWKDIGFQGRNPRTDFRGGGHLSLLCLIYFVDNYPKEFREQAACTKDQEDLMWLTAISSINMTHHLLIFLYMNEAEVANQYTKIRACRNAVKCFSKLNWQDKRTFFELNSFGLRHLHLTWLKMIRESKGDTKLIMGSFQKCMDETKLAILKLLREELRDLNHLINRANRTIASISSTPQPNN
mmetsp:Transcript_2684/g.4521  ORF Transcript_2684/g.4521 Transcript_2684/m.4521 type:complete len:218 (-) Transcript_2684:182-835(-)